MKATKKSILFGTVLLLCVAGLALYLLAPAPLEVASIDIPAPVVVHLAQSNSPLRVFPGVSGVLLILPDGSLWRWGDTGPGNWLRAKIPTQVGTNLNWKQAFAAGNHSVAVRTDGTLWEWGWRANSPAGDPIFCNDPEQVDPGHDWLEASAGDLYSEALRSDGTLWTWHQNRILQFGGSSGCANLTQSGTNDDWTGIIGGGWYSLGLRKNGTLWLWGKVEWFPQIKAGAIFAIPTQVNRDTNWIDLTMRGALRRGQTVEHWNPLFSPPNADAAVSSNGNLLASNWISNRSAIGWVGKQMHYEVRPNGTLWKSAITYQAGGTATPSNKWRQVGKRSDWISIWGDGAVVGLTSDGTVWMWGDDFGQEPIPDARSRFTLLKVRILTLLKRPPKFTNTQADSQYQKEPRPLMRLVPVSNSQPNSTAVPTK